LIKCPSCEFEFYANPTPEYCGDHYNFIDNKQVFRCQADNCNYTSAEFIDDQSID